MSAFDKLQQGLLKMQSFLHEHKASVSCSKAAFTTLTLLMPRGLPTASNAPALTAFVTATPLPLPAISAQQKTVRLRTVRHTHLQMVVGKC